MRTACRHGDRVSEPATRNPRRRWLSEPKTAVWVVLALAVLIGGGRKLSAWWRARKAVLRLGEADVTPADIEAVAEHGRAGVYELLRIFSSPPSEALRVAAGRSSRGSGSLINSSRKKRRPSCGAATP